MTTRTVQGGISSQKQVINTNAGLARKTEPIMPKDAGVVNPRPTGVAVKSSTKSGYARDIAPEAVTADERQGHTVPIATGKGGQVGILAPHERDYPQGVHDIVDADEAQRRMLRRDSGEIPLIPGGLSGPQTRVQPRLSDEEQEAAMAQLDGNTREPGFDPLGPPQPGPEVKTAAQAPPGPTIRAANGIPMAPVEFTTTVCPHAEFLDQRIRVKLAVPLGTMTVVALWVYEVDESITILLPLDGEGATFVPQPGTDLTITVGDEVREAFYPGTHFECEALGLLGLVFIKK